MKLIKLQSEETLTEGIFTNNLYAGGLTLPPKAEICLKNLSLDFDQPEYEVIGSGTEKNNNFQLQTVKSQPASIKIIELTPGKYSLRNLMLEIETKINNSLDSSINGDLCCQYSIGKIMNNKGDINLIFSYKRVDLTTLNDATTEKVNMTYDSGNAYFYKNTTDNGTFNAKLSGNVFVNPGGLQLKCVIKNEVGGNPALSDWVWGIDENKISMLETSKTGIVNLMKACVSNDAGFYTFKKGGVMIQPSTPIPIEANDTLTINKVGGKIRYTVLKGTTPSIVEGDVVNTVLPLLGITKLGCVIHIGNDTGAIAFNSVQISPDCYTLISSGVYTILQPEDVEDVYLNTNLTAIPSNIIQVLTFLNVQTRRLLGFSSERYERPGPTGKFTGDSGLSINFLSNDLEVELIELGTMNSYSQSSKQLKGIVAVIPVSSLKNSTIVSGSGSYELSYDETASWAWLSIDNNDPLRLSALTVRCTSNNEIIKVNGKMTCCLLYKASSENN
jgi:hypothetical protein